MSRELDLRGRAKQAPRDKCNFFCSRKVLVASKVTHFKLLEPQPIIWSPNMDSIQTKEGVSRIWRSYFTYLKSLSRPLTIDVKGGSLPCSSPRSVFRIIILQQPPQWIGYTLAFFDPPHLTYLWPPTGALPQSKSFISGAFVGNCKILQMSSVHSNCYHLTYINCLNTCLQPWPIKLQN